MQNFIKGGNAYLHSAAKGAIAAGLILSASSSFAQDAPAEEATDDAIVVTGSIAAAQEASINAKRQAENLVDIAAADSVGRFPDQNSAAALSRLPAVAVQRDRGQERYIQVRGAPNRWTSVSLDGIPLIGVDEGATHGLSALMRCHSGHPFIARSQQIAYA